MRVFVLNMRGQPLMPTTSAKARILLKEDKAKVVQRKPFTIQLKYATGENKQRIKLGIDPGVKNIGLCAKSEKEILFACEVETRTREVTKNMQTRAMYRHTRKRYKRNKKQRRAIQEDTCFEEREYQFSGYDKSIIAKYIKPSLCRFLNRKSFRKLTPTAKHLLNTHQRIIRKIKKILPIYAVTLEYNSFDIHKLKNPKVYGIYYQKGKQYKSTNFTSYILDRDNYTCRKCNKKNVPLQVHHIVSRSDGGTDIPSNGLTLCTDCHTWTHVSKKNYLYIQKKFSSLDNEFYSSTSLLNIIMPSLLKWLKWQFKRKVRLTYGYKTKDKRRKWKLDKEHWIDAYCCVSKSSFVNIPEIFKYKQFRRHKRANIQSQRDRLYYLDGKLVAKNRNSRIGQDLPSIKDFIEQKVSRMKVKPAIRIYNKMLKFPAGSTVVTNKGIKTVQSTGSKGYLIKFVGEGKRQNTKLTQPKILLQPLGMVLI